MAKTINELDQPKTTNAKRSLSQREDFVGQSYRAITGHPKTSAAIATGVAAAAAGAGFFFARGRNRPADTVEAEVAEMNKDALKDAKS